MKVEQAKSRHIRKKKNFLKEKKVGVWKKWSVEKKKEKVSKKSKG